MLRIGAFTNHKQNMDTRLKDGIPPHNLEAEQATLGALLLDWDGVQSNPSNIFKILSPEKFYSHQNQLIFKAMISLSNKSIKGDQITLIDELSKSGDLEKAGGPGYIASLTNTVPTSANILYYANIVSDMAMRRELIKTSAEFKAASFDESYDSNSILEEAEQKIFALRDKNITSNIHDMRKVIEGTVNIITKRTNSNAPFTGIPSGFGDLDNMTSGFQNSELIIIGARPSMGKTALALSMMEHIAADQKIPCGFFSLEMSWEAIGQRLISQVSKVPGFKLRSGLLREAETKKLIDAAGKLFDIPLYIVDTPNMQLSDIRATARRMVVNNGIKIIFIDYIGLIATDKPNIQVWEQVSQITRSLKSLARELNVPIVALSQVSRDAEGAEPTLAQLRGSGSVEQDADVVMFIHRKRNDENENQVIQDAKLILAKQRNGATGTVNLVFIKDCTKFENASKDREAD